MTNNQLTAEQIVTLQLRIMSALSFYRQRPEKEARRMAELLELAGAAASELKERREAMKPLAGIDLESAVDRLTENCNSIQGVWCSDKRSAYYSGFRDGAAIGLNAEKNGGGDE